MSRVAIYSRKSKPPKGWKPLATGETPPGSVEAQRSKLRAWALAQGQEIALDESDTATGRNPNRPGWQKVMGAVRGGHVQGVAITRTSRAMRNTRHFLEVIEEMERRGCTLEVLEQPAASFRGKMDPMGRAFLTIAGAINQLEVELHAEQSNEVMERRADGKLYGPRSSKPVGRPVKFGPEHKFRERADGARRHDRARCQVCRGQTGGVAAKVVGQPESGGVDEPGGLTTPSENGGVIADGASGAGVAPSIGPVESERGAT